jgi:hypothetical protein
MITTEEELRLLVAGWTFPGWHFDVHYGKLARNRGVTVIGFASNGSTLINAQVTPRAPGRLTNFNMETPIEFPVDEGAAREAGLDLVRWVMLHESAEFFQEDGKPLFDPHDRLNESMVYGEVPIPWQPGE